MAVAIAAQAELSRLRQDIARMEGRLAEADRLVLGLAHAPNGEAVEGAAPGLELGRRRGKLRLGFEALDRVLGGGLPLDALHDIRAVESRDAGAGAGFVLALVARLAEADGMPPVFWVSAAAPRREAGHLYAPGLVALGLDPGSIVQVFTRTGTEALWAFEAALACRGVGVAVCELREASLDLAATRRCALRARDAKVTGFLLRLSSPAEPTAADLRFRLAPAPAGTIGGYAAGIGRMAWRVALEKNRGGRTGSFLVEWNAHERRFVEPEKGRTNPLPLSAAPIHRSDHPSGASEPVRLTAFRRAV